MTERDCSDEVELKNGKALLGGWSTDELWHNGERIGNQYCGAVTITHPHYRFTVVPEGDHKRLTIYCQIGVEEPLQ